MFLKLNNENFSVVHVNFIAVREKVTQKLNLFVFFRQILCQEQSVETFVSRLEGKLLSLP